MGEDGIDPDHQTVNDREIAVAVTAGDASE